MNKFVLNFLITAPLSVWAGSTDHSIEEIEESSALHSASVPDLKDHPTVGRCMKIYKKEASNICDSLQKLKISPTSVSGAKNKIQEMSADNMWWSEERIHEAKQFFDNYLATQELWCTLGNNKRSDEYEKSLAWLSERCRSGFEAASKHLESDQGQLSDLAYKLKSYESLGIKVSEISAKKVEKSLAKLKETLNHESQGHYDQLLKVENIVKTLAELRYGEGSTKNKDALQKMLKECYQLESAYPKAFKAKRPGAPRGYDCASFDPAENP